MFIINVLCFVQLFNDFLLNISYRIMTRRRNLIMQAIGRTARNFRVWQEVWLMPYLGKGGLMVVPLWALDSFVLVLKLCSTCTMAVVKVLIPPVMKSLHGETILVSKCFFIPTLSAPYSQAHASLTPTLCIKDL